MPASFTREVRPALLWYLGHACGLRLRGYHPLCRVVPDDFDFDTSALVPALTPHLPELFAQGFSLAYSPFARRYSGNPFWFLFLGILRCFSSARTPSRFDSGIMQGINPHVEVLFGNPRINGFMRLPVAYIAACRALHRLTNQVIHQQPFSELHV